MVLKKTLFDDNQLTDIRKEVMPLERLKNLEDKITIAIERVKTLKEEKLILHRKIKELEVLLGEKIQEIEQLKSEKHIIKNQIESLLDEIEMLESEKE